MLVTWNVLGQYPVTLSTFCSHVCQAILVIIELYPTFSLQTRIYFIIINIIPRITFINTLLVSVSKVKQNRQQGSVSLVRGGVRSEVGIGIGTLSENWFCRRTERHWDILHLTLLEMSETTALCALNPDFRVFRTMRYAVDADV